MNTSDIMNAWADAASYMVAAAVDREGCRQAIEDMVDAGRWADLARTAIAAIEIGGTLIEREAAAEGQPGPVLDYVVAVCGAAR